MFLLKTHFVVFLLTTLLAKDVISFRRDQVGVDDVTVDMDMRRLYLREGQEHGVSCTVNKPRSFFNTSPVEFNFFKLSDRLCEDCSDTILTHNDQVVVEGGDDYYDVYVTTPAADVTTFHLVFKNPRRVIDHGYLSCSLIIDPRLGSWVSKTTTRLVLIYSNH